MNKPSEQQLLDDIKELFPNFKCTMQDLRNPTEEFVTNFYSYWLQEFEVDIANVSQIQFSQMGIVGQYQDAYCGATPKINLLKCIREFNVIQDFGMLDIISPSPKRIQAVIRAFIDFYLWSDLRISSLIEKKKNLNDRKEKLQNLIKEREDLKVNLNNIIKSIAQFLDTKKQVEDEILSLQKRFSELNQEKHITKCKTTEMQEKLKDKEIALQKINKEEQQVSNKLNELSSMVVDSPTTMLTDLESLHNKHDEMKELSEQARDMVESAMQKQSKLLKDVENQQLRFGQLSEIVSLIDQQRNLLKVVEIVEKDMMEAQEHLSNLKATLLSHAGKRANYQEKLRSLYFRWKTLQPQLTESVEAAIRELTEKKKEKNKINDSLKEDSAVQEKLDLLMNKIKRHVEDFNADYEALNKQTYTCLSMLEEKAHNHMENVKKEIQEKYSIEEQKKSKS